MSLNSPIQTRDSAMTLPEVIVVLFVIVVLLGFIVDCGHIPRNQANKIRAKTDLMGTVAAVKQYYTEYGEYPLAGQKANVDITFGDAASGARSAVSNEALFNILRNYPEMERPTPDGNARQVVFYECKPATPTGRNPRGGFATSSTGGTGVVGALYDPWGNQ